ncbi:Serine carboxypeptidase II-3 [Apostasia shenzhenica]|uniref:Carboxypeptidase n=1 Tax=Apostasia shenzhenica TaxID=1088818 RepID=A0A2I0AVE5_9ASPA|nr:Serine carboxypeptidase II-3 [Apostasia shenzhenica]
MRSLAPVLLPLLLCCFLMVSQCRAKPSIDEADHLRRFIDSQRSMKIMRDRLWTMLGSKNGRSSAKVGPKDGPLEDDRIDALPGQPQGVSFHQYSGYVTVDASAGRTLFYYFAEAPQDPSTKALVLWLNGGPGCSSLGAGAMQELGPFRVNSDGKSLHANDYAWNNLANVIFLESPAGVGFSYSNTSSDYQKTGDTSTAADAHAFLINWLERFPQYKGRDFFITGESYAGHYIPELASLILKSNAASSNTVINLKGIAIGNAYVDGSTNEKATYDYYWTHALIGDETYKAIQSSCKFSAAETADCEEALNAARREAGNIDSYNIYAPLCQRSSSSNKAIIYEPDPCAGFYVNNYLNNAEVQKALHVKGTSSSPYPWSFCSDVLGYWRDSPETTLPIIKQLIGSGLRVWLYSGDQDAVVPVTSTKDSIEKLGLSVATPWQAWYTNGEVGGYVVVYKGLTFATVRGAGHMVPSYQPERALTLFSNFLKGGF